MLGFNDQRGRGCILAGRKNEREKRGWAGGGGGGGTGEGWERAKEGQANNGWRKKARRSWRGMISRAREGLKGELEPPMVSVIGGH